MIFRAGLAAACAAGYVLLTISPAATAALPAAPTGADKTFSGAEWRPIDFKKAVAAATKITTAAYPDCDSAIVDQNSVREYKVDGAGGMQDETFTKVLTEKGKRDNRSFSMGYTLPYLTADLPLLEVIKPDGSVVPVDVAANSSDSIDTSQMAENIYDPNTRLLTVNIPQLDIGDTIHSIARYVIRRPYIPGEFSDGNVFEGPEYIRHISYVIYAPAKRPLVSMVLRGKVPGTITESKKPAGNQIVYRWEVNNVPRMYDEPSMPPYEMALQRIFVSTTSNWRQLSKWYWSLNQSHLAKTTPAMNKTVRDLTAHCHTDLDKVTAIFYYVSHTIRYMGVTPEKDRPGLEPHDVCLTFERKYGVCRDKAALLVSMLRLAGFHAYPILINVGAQIDADVPRLAFNHAIVAVELTKGSYTLMDPTDETTHDLLPTYDSNLSYLVCRPEGETLRTSAIPSPDKSMASIRTTGVLSADGVLSAMSEITYTGVNDDTFRSNLSRMKPAEQRSLFERLLKTAIPGAKLTTVTTTPTNMLDTSTPLHVELKYVAGGLTANGGGKSIVSVPWLSSQFAVVNWLVASGSGLQVRKYPLIYATTCGLREDISLKLSGGFAGPIAIPKFSVADKSMGYSENVSYGNQQLTCAREFKLKTIELSPSRYLELKHTLKNMAYDGRKNVIMALSKPNVGEQIAGGEAPAGPAPTSNAQILDSEQSLELTDAHTAVFHAQFSKKILTYDGKARESEVKIPYDPACEDVKIVHASVISPTGARQEISPSEINIMDQDWNATAKRYTGGKILVASLPGVDIGSTIDVAYDMTMKDKPFIGGLTLFQFQDALKDKSFQIKAPAGLDVKTLITGPQGVVKQGNGLQWTASDVKALATEPYLPPSWNYQAGVVYFAGDAPAYWKSLSDAMVGHAGYDDAASALAKRLTSAAGGDPIAQVKAIRDFIAENITVAGPSFTDLPLGELSDADTTLKDGYGDGADCAILYYAMLKAAGFQPEFMMASGLPPIPTIGDVAQSFPLPTEFETPLVRVSVAGDEYYLGDSDQYAQLGTTESDGKLAVSLTDQSMTTIHAAQNCANKTETDYAVSVGKDGKARINISKLYFGENYNTQKKTFSELRPEERQRFFQEVVSGVAQGARPVSGLTTKFDSYPGLVKFAVELDNFAVVDGKYLYFNLPLPNTLFGSLANDRTLPMYVANANKTLFKAELSLPSSYRYAGIGPKNQKLVAPGGSSATISRTDTGRTSVVTEEFDTVPGVILPKNYPDLLKIQSVLGRKSGSTFLMQQE